MSNFICNSDLIVMDKLLVKKGDIVSSGDIVECDYIKLKLELDYLNKSELFKEVVSSKIDIEIVESPDDENIDKDWVLQIKLTTSRSKLRTIESFLNDNLVKLL